MIEADRLISAGTTLPEDVADRAIRPKLLEEYVGQFTLTNAENSNQHRED